MTSEENQTILMSTFNPVHFPSQPEVVSTVMLRALILCKQAQHKYGYLTMYK